jgi:hypothetical protein
MTYSLWAAVDGNDVLLDHGQGFTLIQLDTGISLSGYSLDEAGGHSSRQMIPRQGGFLEGNTKIITGSRNGEVHVYNRAGGHPLMILPHGNDTPVETIAVRRIQSVWTIR